MLISYVRSAALRQTLIMELSVFFALMDYLVEFTGECIINHCYADLSL